MSTGTDDDGGPRQMTYGRPSAASEGQPDDRSRPRIGVPCRVADDLEAGPLEHRQSPLVDVGRGDPPAGRVRRVGLEHGRAVAPGVIDGRGQQRRRDASPAMPSRDDEADDRPDRRVVDRGEDPRVGEPLVARARTEAHPADGASPA